MKGELQKDAGERCFGERWAGTDGKVVKTNLEILTSDSLMEEVRVITQRWERLGTCFSSSC